MSVSKLCEVNLRKKQYLGAAGYISKVFIENDVILISKFSYNKSMDFARSKSKRALGWSLCDYARDFDNLETM